MGLIPKNYVLTLIEGRAFYRMDGMVEDEPEPNYAIQDRSTTMPGRKSVKGSAVNYNRTETFQLKRK